MVLKKKKCQSSNAEGNFLACPFPNVFAFDTQQDYRLARRPFINYRKKVPSGVHIRLHRCIKQTQDMHDSSFKGLRQNPAQNPARTGPDTLTRTRPGPDWANPAICAIVKLHGIRGLRSCIPQLKSIWWVYRSPYGYAGNTTQHSPRHVWLRLIIGSTVRIAI